jgi:hypothetical protein
MNRRRKVARLMPRAAEFAIGSRQSLGLSVITNEGSTTKKLIVAMRLFGPLNGAIIKSIIASNQDARYGLRNVQKPRELQGGCCIAARALPDSKNLFLYMKNYTD